MTALVVAARNTKTATEEAFNECFFNNDCLMGVESSAPIFWLYKKKSQKRKDFKLTNMRIFPSRRGSGWGISKRFYKRKKGNLANNITSLLSKNLAMAL